LSNRGGTTTSLKKHIEDLDLTPFNTVILQFGGNDADRDIEIHDFNRNYLNIIQEIQKCNEVKHIVVGGIVPRTKKNTEKYNKELKSICRQENIDFVNHLENFLLKNGKIVNGLLYSDGVHLTKDGTSLLINNINDKVGILKHENDKNETPPNGAPKRNKNVHVRPPRRRPCFNCGENNHSQNQCRFNARLECFQSHGLGHKAKL
jgi:hypothetical protein